MLKDNTYITITRQYGSGGKEVANIVAKKLGINCYDRKIVHLAPFQMPNPNNLPPAPYLLYQTRL